MAQRAGVRPLVLAVALVLACEGVPAQQRDDTDQVLREHRDGLEAGAERVMSGAQRIEGAAQMDVRTIAEGTASVAEGFCMMVNSNAGAFAALGVDFSGLVKRAGDAGDAERYQQAEDACAQVQARGQSFALAGCTDVVVGGRTTLSASLATGSYRFTANRGGVVDIATRGNSATVTGVAPGVVTVEAERRAGGATTRASEVVHSLEVVSINDDVPARIGMYNARGRRIATEVGVDVRPRAAARRVVYRPSEPILAATGDAGGRLRLEPSETGVTSVQAMTACGEPTGAPLQVEVVPCTHEVRDALRQEERRLMRRRDKVLAAISEVLNDPEYERALREFRSHAFELTAKIIELTAKVGVRSDATGALAVAGKLPDIYNLLTHVYALATAKDDGDIARTAIKAWGDAVGNLADFGFENPVTGAIKSAIEAGMSAQDVGQDVGTTLGTVERLQELEAQLDGIVRELEDVWRRMALCKERPAPADGEPAPEPPPTPAAEPGPGSGPRGAPPQQLEIIEIGGDETMPPGSDGAGDPPATDPVEPPPSPAGAAALAALVHEGQCPGWEPVADRQSGVFGALGRNLGSLQGHYAAQESQLIEPLVRQLEASREALAVFAASDGLPPGQREAGMEEVRSLLDANPPEALLESSARLERLAVGTRACSEVLPNSFEVKIEELRLRY